MNCDCGKFSESTEWEPNKGCYFCWAAWFNSRRGKEKVDLEALKNLPIQKCCGKDN